MSLKSKALIVLAVAEATYGTAVAADGTNAIMTSNASLSPLEGSTLSRNLDRATFGNDQQLHYGSHVMMSFDVELVGSGTLGTAPAWGKLMKACGCTETVTATTSVVYTPNSDSTESMTMYFYMDGQLHKMTGARGTFKINGDSGSIPHINFSFTGLWVDPASSAAPSPTGWDDFQTPKPVSYAHTPTVTLFGLASVFKNFTFDQGNEVHFFDNPGEQEVSITDRKSKGSLSILAPKLSDKNYFTTAKANTLGALSFVQGKTDTKRVEIASPAGAQILSPKYGDDQGRATLEADLAFVPTSAGDDEWAINLEAAP